MKTVLIIASGLIIISISSCGVATKIHKLKSPLRHTKEVATPFCNRAIWSR